MKKHMYLTLLTLVLLCFTSCTTTTTAIEAPQVYALTYDLAGGTYAEDAKINPSSYSAEDPSFTLANPIRTGYDFTGWTVGAGTDPSLVMLVDTTALQNLQFTANWKIIEYTLAYDETGYLYEEEEVVTETIPETNRLTYTVDDEFSLINPILDGYTFKGWITEGEPVDTANAHYTIIKGTTGDKQMIAVWEPVEYSVTYILNGGYLPAGSENPATVDVLVQQQPLANPVRDFYNFVGWKLTGTEDQPTTKYILDYVTSDLEIEAIWSPIEYQITFDLDNGSFAADTVVPATYNIENFETVYASVAKLQPARTAYSFGGWYFTPTVEELLANVPAAITIHASWDPVVYSLEYDLNGGAFRYGATNKDSYTIETETFQLNNPFKKNCVFAGWVTEGDNEGNLINPVTIEQGSMGDKMYYAVFHKGEIPVGFATVHQQSLTILGKDGIIRPDWVVALPADTASLHYEKGYAMQGDFYASLQEAEKRALIEFAKWNGVSVAFNLHTTDFGNEINSMLSTIDANLYANTKTAKGAIDTIKAVADFNSDSETLDSFSMIVKYRQVVEYWEDAQGGVWVLVSAPISK